jgi:hydroxymethylbilane synthase
MRSLAAVHPHVEIGELHVTTTGDRVQDRALNQIGGKGLFIKEIEEALLENRAAIAVHSLKDVPAELAETLVIACIPKRVDPRDVLVTHSGCSFDELPQGARVGTSSLRRSVQLGALRPDLQFLPLRGNVDTRLRRCKDGDYDAIVLAHAGLLRLGLADRVTQVLDAERCVPAIGQGALAIECRQDDSWAASLLEPLVDPDTAVAVAAERGVMLAVEGSCQIPVAAHAQRRGTRMQISAMLAETDGTNLRRKDLDVAWPSNEVEARGIGIELGHALKAS